MSPAVLLVAASFVLAAIALHRNGSRAAGAQAGGPRPVRWALAVAAVLVPAAFLDDERVVVLAVAALGPLTLLVVTVLAGRARWSRTERAAALVGVLGAVAAATTPLWGGRDGLDVVAGLAVSAVLALLCLSGADDAGDPGRPVRALWLALGGGAAGVGAAGTWVLLSPGGPAALTDLCTAVSALAVPAGCVLAVRGTRRVDVRRLTAAVVGHGVTTLAALAGFAGTAAVVELVTGAPAGRPVLLVVLLLVAPGYAPLLGVLRPQVESLLFGRRLDPLPVLADLGRELQRGTTTSWLAALCRACDLPWAEITADARVVARSGAPTGAGSTGIADGGIEDGGVEDGGVEDGGVHRTELRMDGQVVGELRVGLTGRDSALPRETTVVLALLATPLAHAVRSARLAADLQRSRERTVAARDEERRRVGNDLHDGLGASLTGLGYSADAAARLVGTRPDDARDVLEQLRADAHDALALVRRTVAGLRPADLEGVGLVAALQRFCDRYRDAGLEVSMASGALPALPGDVEVAVHRIVTEAVTNAARHSTAAHVGVDLRSGAGELLVTVTDDGAAGTGRWDPGTGLTSMRERSEELGGRLVAGPTPAGGRVELRVPIAVGVG